MGIRFTVKKIFKNPQQMKNICFHLKNGEFAIYFDVLRKQAERFRCNNAVMCVNAGFLDWVPRKMQRVGCMELLNTVQRRVQPKLHVFGHIHEGKVPHVK